MRFQELKIAYDGIPLTDYNSLLDKEALLTSEKDNIGSEPECYWHSLQYSKLASYLISQQMANAAFYTPGIYSIGFKRKISDLISASGNAVALVNNFRAMKPSNYR